jgi:hypothetical protein
MNKMKTKYTTLLEQFSYSGVKPVIQPIRAKNIYKSSPLIAIIVSCMFRKIGSKELSDRSLPVPVAENCNKSTKFTGTHVYLINLLTLHNSFQMLNE